jgi:spermidine/putrescine transport system ATP-binding protein
MADCIAVMNEGRIEQAGGAADLYERPQTEFVARFLGVSNLVRGRVRAADEVETHDGAVLRAPQCGDTGREVKVGVRPEKVTLVPAGAAVPDGANVLRGHVSVGAFLGPALQYVVTTAGGDELIVIVQNAEGAAPDALAPGREVSLAWAPRHTFVV